MNINLTVSGMTCAHCERAVLEALKGVKGVDHASVNRDAGTASVSGNVDVGQLVAAVAEEGYEAREAA